MISLGVTKRLPQVTLPMSEVLGVNSMAVAERCQSRKPWPLGVAEFGNRAFPVEILDFAFSIAQTQTMPPRFYRFCFLFEQEF